jgi:hypothetical protein
MKCKWSWWNGPVQVRLEGGGAGRAAEEDPGRELASDLADRCYRFLYGLLEDLDAHLDVRLVRTLAATVTALVRHRNRPQGLLLSELGAYLAGPEHAPAGTKRLANLLHSPKWQAEEIDDYLLLMGHCRVAYEARRVPEGRALCILDGSVIEKPESAQLAGLAPVRSSKARRLGRPRPKQGPGYWRGKPGKPVVVPGFGWVGVLVTGWASQMERRPLTFGAWHWYTKPPQPPVEAPAAEAPPGEVAPGEVAPGEVAPGEVAPATSPAEAPVEAPPAPSASDVCYQRAAEADRTVLARVVGTWGAERLLHVWDRGLSGAPWLGEALDQDWHFVVRWKKGNHLRRADAPSVGDPAATPTQQDRDGVAAWRLTAGLRPWGRRRIANPHNPKQPVTVSFAARPVRLLHRDDPLWLIVARLGKSGKGGTRQRGSGEPWRLLTTEPVTTEQECWRIVEAYIARWQVELMLRFGKCELGLESVRVRDWEPRRKLWTLAALAYAFLLELLGTLSADRLRALLRWAHRTGRQAATALRPLYRLRAALAALWQKHTPSFQGGP